MTDVKVFPIILQNVETLSSTLKMLSFGSHDADIRLPVTSEGAHIRLHLDSPERSWINAYSLVNAPGERRLYQIVVRRSDVSRGGSSFVHDRLTIGNRLLMEGPDNLFPSAKLARHHLLLSAGIGITPFVAYGKAFRQAQKSFSLHQLCRPTERHVYVALTQSFSAAVQFHSGRADIDLGTILTAQPLGTHVYVCGPSGFIDAVRNAAFEAGYPRDKVHWETFATGSAGQAFKVRLARSGRTITVPPDRSLLEALEECGVGPPSMCRGGSCGECAVALLDGTPDHRDHVLSERERMAGRVMMSCVSRAANDELILDL